MAQIKQEAISVVRPTHLPDITALISSRLKSKRCVTLQEISDCSDLAERVEKLQIYTFRISASDFLEERDLNTDAGIIRTLIKCSDNQIQIKVAELLNHYIKSLKIDSEIFDNAKGIRAASSLLEFYRHIHNDVCVYILPNIVAGDHFVNFLCNLLSICSSTEVFSEIVDLFRANIERLIPSTGVDMPPKELSVDNARILIGIMKTLLLVTKAFDSPPAPSNRLCEIAISVIKATNMHLCRLHSYNIIAFLLRKVTDTSIIDATLLELIPAQAGHVIALLKEANHPGDTCNWTFKYFPKEELKDSRPKEPQTLLTTEEICTPMPVHTQSSQPNRGFESKHGENLTRKPTKESHTKNSKPLKGDSAAENPIGVQSADEFCIDWLKRLSAQFERTKAKNGKSVEYNRESWKAKSEAISFVISRLEHFQGIVNSMPVAPQIVSILENILKFEYVIPIILGALRLFTILMEKCTPDLITSGKSSTLVELIFDRLKEGNKKIQSEAIIAVAMMMKRCKGTMLLESIKKALTHKSPISREAVCNIINGRANLPEGVRGAFSELQVIRTALIHTLNSMSSDKVAKVRNAAILAKKTLEGPAYALQNRCPPSNIVQTSSVSGFQSVLEPKDGSEKFKEAKSNKRLAAPTEAKNKLKRRFLKRDLKNSKNIANAAANPVENAIPTDNGRISECIQPDDASVEFDPAGDIVMKSPVRQSYGAKKSGESSFIVQHQENIPNVRDSLGSRFSQCDDGKSDREPNKPTVEGLRPNLSDYVVFDGIETSDNALGTFKWGELPSGASRAPFEHAMDASSFSPRKNPFVSNKSVINRSKSEIHLLPFVGEDILSKIAKRGPFGRDLCEGLSELCEWMKDKPELVSSIDISLIRFVGECTEGFKGHSKSGSVAIYAFLKEILNVELSHGALDELLVFMAKEITNPKALCILHLVLSKYDVDFVTSKLLEINSCSEKFNVAAAMLSILESLVNSDSLNDLGMITFSEIVNFCAHCAKLHSTSLADVALNILRTLVRKTSPKRVLDPMCYNYKQELAEKLLPTAIGTDTKQTISGMTEIRRSPGIPSNLSKVPKKLEFAFESACLGLEKEISKDLYLCMFQTGNTNNIKRACVFWRLFVQKCNDKCKSMLFGEKNVRLELLVWLCCILLANISDGVVLDTLELICKEIGNLQQHFTRRESAILVEMMCMYIENGRTQGLNVFSKILSMVSLSDDERGLLKATAEGCQHKEWTDLINGHLNIVETLSKSEAHKAGSPLGETPTSKKSVTEECLHPDYRESTLDISSDRMIDDLTSTDDIEHFKEPDEHIKGTDEVVSTGLSDSCSNKPLEDADINSRSNQISLDPPDPHQENREQFCQDRAILDDPDPLINQQFTCDTQLPIDKKDTEEASLEKGSIGINVSVDKDNAVDGNKYVRRLFSCSLEFRATSEAVNVICNHTLIQPTDEDSVESSKPSENVLENQRTEECSEPDGGDILHGSDILKRQNSVDVNPAIHLNQEHLASEFPPEPTIGDSVESCRSLSRQILSSSNASTDLSNHGQANTDPPYQQSKAPSLSSHALPSPGENFFNSASDKNGNFLKQYIQFVGYILSETSWMANVCMLSTFKDYRGILFGLYNQSVAEACVEKSINILRHLSLIPDMRITKSLAPVLIDVCHLVILRLCKEVEIRLQKRFSIDEIVDTIVVLVDIFDMVIEPLETKFLLHFCAVVIHCLALPRLCFHRNMKLYNGLSRIISVNTISQSFDILIKLLLISIELNSLSLIRGDGGRTILAMLRFTKILQIQVLIKLKNRTPISKSEQQSLYDAHVTFLNALEKFAQSGAEHAIDRKLGDAIHCSTVLLRSIEMS